MKKHIAILGSTGSIGTQALEVIRGLVQQSPNNAQLANDLAVISDEFAKWDQASERGAERPEQPAQ